MTQPYDDYDTDDSDDDGSQVTLSRQQIRAMERDAKQARQLREENQALQNRLAFSGIGAELTDKQQKAVLANLEGDPTSESIRSAAQELGFIAATPSVQEQENGALERIASASTGSPDEASDDDIARLHRAGREGGRDGILAELARNGRTIVASG